MELAFKNYIYNIYYILYICYTYIYILLFVHKISNCILCKKIEDLCLKWNYCTYILFTLLKMLPNNSPAVIYRRQEALLNLEPCEGTDMDISNCSIGQRDKWAIATARAGRGSRTGRRGAKEDLLENRGKGRALKRPSRSQDKRSQNWDAGK